MTIMADTPDITEQDRETRGLQRKAARALDELLGLDLPPVSWEISAFDWLRGKLFGNIYRMATPTTFDVAAQEVVLERWAAHFGVDILPRHPDLKDSPNRLDLSRKIEFSFHDVPVAIYTSVPARPAEEDPQPPESAE